MLDIRIALSGPHWHQPICLRFYGYYPGCSALSSHQFLFYKLINCLLQEGLVPDGLKKTVVTPLIKKASLPVEDLKNYRPVSGLSFISKRVECVVAKKLVDHIHRHGLDNTYQSAYKSGHSTETALLSIKMIFICHYLRVKLLPWYFWIFRPPLILLIIPLSSAVF